MLLFLSGAFSLLNYLVPAREPRINRLPDAFNDLLLHALRFFSIIFSGFEDIDVVLTLINYNVSDLLYSV
jgi:hypothetical protein